MYNGLDISILVDFYCSFIVFKNSRPLPGEYYLKYLPVACGVPELRLRRADLSKEYGAGEEDDADEQEEDEQAELSHAGADRLSEDL